MIEPDRIKHLNAHNIRLGKHLIYWMQASQRTSYNHALQYSIEQANKHNQPLIVYFGITDKFPEANARHYQFMLEGLIETKNELEKLGIKTIISMESPEIGINSLAHNASMVIVDRGYLTIQQQWRQQVAQTIKCPLIQVESDVIIPIETVSQKEEYSAATIRPKIMDKISNYLKKISIPSIKNHSIEMDYPSFDISNIAQIIDELNLINIVHPVTSFKGGTSEAEKHLEKFIKEKLAQYPNRNDPSLNIISNMSPYLHFGHISPLYIALRIIYTGSPATEEYLDQLIVRRELSMNYVYYNKNYATFAAIPSWAQSTLYDHRIDRRPIIYTSEELEHAETHDPYWNAAQKEMIQTGKMHSYMRMYWGKKIIEWTEQPEKAFEQAIFLNNKYELDGRDPNGFTGIAWCFGKHDRPWKERDIFGTVRYMNAKGLERKFDINTYTRRYLH